MNQPRVTLRRTVCHPVTVQQASANRHFRRADQGDRGVTFVTQPRASGGALAGENCISYKVDVENFVTAKRSPVDLVAALAEISA